MADDVAPSRRRLRRLSEDTRQSAAPARREVAQALAHIRNPRFRDLLVPLMYDASRDVAEEAIKSAGLLGGRGLPVRAVAAWRSCGTGC